MATKTFSDFAQIGTGNDELLASDYLVGYRTNAAGVSYETKVTAKTLISMVDDFADRSSIGATKILYSPEGNSGLPTDLNTKLNQFKSTEDFVQLSSSPTDSTAAGTASLGKRLFVAAGKEIRILVPSQFPTIAEALAAIAQWHIENGAVVKILVTQDQEIPGGILLNHPCGQNIQILGAFGGVEGNRVSLRILTSLVSLNFNLFTCSNGHRVGLINHFYLEGRAPSTKGVWGSNTYAAILATHGSFINLGSNMKIKNWYYGVKAMYGSVVNADNIIINEIVNNDTSAQGGDAGLYAYAGSQISAKNSVSNLNYVVATVISGAGYKAECASQIDCDKSVARYNRIGGFMAYTNSQIGAGGCVASNTVNGSGFVAREMGEIECYNLDSLSLTSSSNNQDYGFLTLTGGAIHGSTGLAVGNAKGAYNKSATVGVSGANDLKAGVVSNDTSMRLDTTFIDRIATQLEILDSDGGNRVTVRGSAAGDIPTISVDGTDPTSNIMVKAKLAGKVILGDSVNSNVQFGTFTASSGTLTPAGYITITDKTGVSRKLMVVQG